MTGWVADRALRRYRPDMGHAAWQGFSERLQTPADLLDKLRHDYERVRADPHDAYAAMDFFVTAEHIVDWVWPDDAKARKVERSREPMATVSHLASGAKHFRADAPQHQSVDGVATRSGAFQVGVFQADAFDVGGLVISRSDRVTIGILTLAREVLERCEAMVS